MVRLHPHARERMEERGATEEEVRATVEQGEPWFCRKFPFWRQNPKIGYRKFNSLKAPKLSKKQLCDRTQWGARNRHCMASASVTVPSLTALSRANSSS